MAVIRRWFGVIGMLKTSAQNLRKVPKS